MVATSCRPSQVPITMPSTSPMAHPVKQCSVADVAIFQLAAMSSPHSRQNGTPLPYTTVLRAARLGRPGSGGLQGFVEGGAEVENYAAVGLHGFGRGEEAFTEGFG